MLGPSNIFAILLLLLRQFYRQFIDIPLSFCAILLPYQPRMDVECCHLLAPFLSSFTSSSAKWLPILFNVENSLSLFLGLDYHLRYIPLLSKCGLVKEKIGPNGLKTYTLCQTSSQKGGYSWNSFFAEYNLCGVELSTCTSNSSISSYLFYGSESFMRVHSLQLNNIKRIC